MSADPLRVVWDALERADCGPHGQLHSFRARCPAHQGENPSALHVSVGADGRALLWCHAHGCAADEIASALGLGLPDLFPPGHRRARRWPLREAKRADFQGGAREVVNVLAGLEGLGGGWFLQLRCDCAWCGAPAAVLFATPRFVTLECPGHEQGVALGHAPWTCTLSEFQQALAGRLEDRGAA